MYRGGDSSRSSLYDCLRDVPGAREILPSPHVAGVAYRELQRCILAILDATDATEVTSGSLTLKKAKWSENWFEGLQRKYRPTGELGRGRGVGQGEPRRQLALGLDICPAREEVWGVWDALQLTKLPNAWLVPAFKELSEVAKKHGELLWPQFWMHLVGGEGCFGAPPVKDADFSDQLESWVHTRKKEDEPGSDRRRLVEEGLREVARREMVFKPQLGVEEWLRSPSQWLANGATTSRALEGSKRTKFSTYLASSKEELMADLMSTKPPENKVNPKRERTKTRNTISSDWDLYLQMKFLTQGVEEALETVFPTTLGKKLKQVDRWNMWRRRISTSVGVPIDQSTFDHVPWMEVMVSMIRYMCECARKKSPQPELHHRITELVIARIRSGFVKWEGHTWRHLRGLLSGWAWTSALGTLMNFVEFVGIVQVTRGIMPEPDSMGFQGDDAILFANSWRQAVTWVQTYMRVLPVNPGKFFVSSSRTEFLRMVITKDRVTGYLFRAVPSMMYANAWAGGAMSVQSTASSWSRLVARGGDLARVREHCIRDLTGFTRAPPRDRGSAAHSEGSGWSRAGVWQVRVAPRGREQPGRG